MRGVGVNVIIGCRVGVRFVLDCACVRACVSRPVRRVVPRPVLCEWRRELTRKQWRRELTLFLPCLRPSSIPCSDSDAGCARLVQSESHRTSKRLRFRTDFCVNTQLKPQLTVSRELCFVRDRSLRHVSDRRRTHVLSRKTVAHASHRRASVDPSESVPTWSQRHTVHGADW